ncbi:hypothetical protein SAM23877_0244 [Streptomyces ambofaciens ATCC 23877]|uniref:Uncharacterized protein n=1 Tax=Streptomyces ambofaciens (strain ATCC 23877 / 3486 / DSM 40053 / JCM 4204 / NBRC 12836 / NRRL B-2516) TaxID=278992 RepID=A0A0K2AJU9_STRA7|nr:hypothetical protein SAM23877_0244 [Streptomyces ambofaciens ATCC 23877]
MTYRAEHLAARLLDEHGPAALAATDDLPALVHQAAHEAYDEGYERGVHDHDRPSGSRAPTATRARSTSVSSRS